MKNSILYIIILLFTINVSPFVVAQTTSITGRTPEQEASKQTEKLQKELKLSPNQTKKIYEINLKYAYERKQSNKRKDAVDRVKKKNEEICRVLNEKQNDELQSIRSTIQSVEIDGERSSIRTDPKSRAINSTAKRHTSITQGTDRPTRNDQSAIRQENTGGNSRQTINRPVRNGNTNTEPTRQGAQMNRGNNSSKEIRPATTPTRTNSSSSNNDILNRPAERKSENSGKRSSDNPNRSRR